MKISYITRYDSLDIHNWSGTEYFIAKSLEKQGADVNIISGLKEEIGLPLRIKNKIYGRKHKYLIRRSPEIGKGYARQISERMTKDTDIVFSPGTETIAYLDTKVPKVFYTDATFASMIGYYDWFDNLSHQTIKEGMKMEQLALDTCRLAIYSSEWAARSAIDRYKANPEKVRVVPLGANIETYFTYEEIQKLIQKKDRTRCRIIFIGIDWYRKGGDVVLDTVKYLNEQLRLPTTLHIVGIDHLPLEKMPEYVVNHGRIDKNTKEGILKIENLIAQSHFLFVPSRAEAYGLVFSEAMAFGVPCIATNTGGIPTIVNDDLTGVLLHVDSPPEEYARHIYDIYTDETRYKEMALAAYADYNQRLNWDVTGKTILKYLEEIL